MFAVSDIGGVGFFAVLFCGFSLETSLLGTENRVDTRLNFLYIHPSFGFAVF
jgi:hypothetical protein